MHKSKKENDGLFLADMAAIEAEQKKQLIEVMQHDATYRRNCGAESSGCTIVGCNVQACDGCIAD